MKTNNIERETLITNLAKIDKMIALSKTDKTISVKDLRIERKNCVLAQKKLNKK